MAAQLVDSFNALPRKPKGQHGRPNEWHFDLRYIHLEPTPSHVLFLTQLNSEFVHMERLPIGLETYESGISFFPESGKEAAPEIAEAILHCFVTNLGQNELMGPKAPPPFAPWKLTTEDKDLATAVGNEFRRLGVRAEGLYRIGISTNLVMKKAQTSFGAIFDDLKKEMHMEDRICRTMITPTSIIFENIYAISGPAPLAAPRIGRRGTPFDLPLKYAEAVANARPPKQLQFDSHGLAARCNEEMFAAQELVTSKPEAVVKAEADSGNPGSALDYGLRLTLGFECKADRALSRKYLAQAASCQEATDEIRSIAHSLLIYWYMSPFKDMIRMRYLYAASHHANLAVKFARSVSPPGAPPTPEVSRFMSTVFEHHAAQLPDLKILFDDAWTTWSASEQKLKAGQQKLEEKRMKNPLRYRCATEGCGIEADKGKMLSRCSGKCDEDKKPSYCSKACQKADWKNHKPFCKPGAPCSVIDTGTSSQTNEAVPQSRHGVLQVPITAADGSTMLIRSSTIGVDMLRDIRDAAANSDRPLPAIPAGTIFEVEEFET